MNLEPLNHAKKSTTPPTHKAGRSPDERATGIAWNDPTVRLRSSPHCIKIGVNDVWRLQGEWNGQKFVPFAEYKANYLKLLETARAVGIRKLVLMSPSAIADNQNEEMSRHLDERAACVQELAARFGAIYVPIREIQKRAMRQYPKVKWTTDGCHPTTDGHALFAHAWIEAVGL